MEWVIINTLLYLFTFIIVYRYKKKLDEGCFLLSIYLITAIFNQLYYPTHTYYYNNISLSPFIYLYVILMLFFRPYLINRKDIVDKLTQIKPNSKQYKVLYIMSILYIGFSIISVYYSLSQIYENIAKDAWGEIYGNEDKYENPYVNILDGIAKRYTDYLRPVILLFSFYLLAFYYKKKIQVLFIIISVLVSTMIAAAAVASRGNIINICLLIALCYILFRRKIPQTLNIYIYIISGVFISILGVYFISVTIARFGEGSGSYDSLLFYAGHSMLTFNDGIFYQTSNYSWGSYFFSYFVNLFGYIPIESNIDPKAQGLFITFVGTLYRDFSPILLFFIALVFPMWVMRICHIKKKHIDFADLYMYIFYIKQLASGFTVGSPFDGFLWGIAFIIYFGLKFLFRVRWR